MSNVSTINQERELLIRLLSLLSDILNSINNDYSATVTSIKEVEDGVEYRNGKDDLVYKLKVMKET